MPFLTTTNDLYVGARTFNLSVESPTRNIYTTARLFLFLVILIVKQWTFLIQLFLSKRSHNIGVVGTGHIKPKEDAYQPNR